MLARGTYGEVEARMCVHQALRGIAYLHSQHIVHRDLKLENMLLKRPNDITSIKITDFGLAKDDESEAMTSMCGTPHYVAPEVLQVGGWVGGAPGCIT